MHLRFCPDSFLSHKSSINQSNQYTNFFHVCFCFETLYNIIPIPAPELTYLSSPRHTSFLTLGNIIQLFSTRSGVILNKIMKGKRKGKDSLWKAKPGDWVALFNLSLAHTLTRSKFFLPSVCVCLWLTEIAAGAFIFRSQINVSHQENLQLQNPQTFKRQ